VALRVRLYGEHRSRTGDSENRAPNCDKIRIIIGLRRATCGAIRFQPGIILSTTSAGACLNVIDRPGPTSTISGRYPEMQMKIACRNIGEIRAALELGIR
jgi:hypothetical protein